MRILYVGMRHDYGRPERGLSFEHFALYESLRGAGHEVRYFDFAAIAAAEGSEAMNRRLRDEVASLEPELLFSVLFANELDPAVISEISFDTPTTTLNWFCDDHWRFDAFTRHWAPCFNWVVTTAASALPKYAALGYENVIKSQWGFSETAFRRSGRPPVYDIAFVGQRYGDRAVFIDALKSHGFAVETWGPGWDHDRLDHEGMVDVFSRSRINLNFSRASVVPSRGPSIVGRVRDRLRPLPPPTQIKARLFEVAGCGGFVLTEAADGVEEYYVPDVEMVVFRDTAELVDKARYYLEHDDARAAIARAARERTLREHTYARRFAEIFTRMGLADGAPAKRRR